MTGYRSQQSSIRLSSGAAQVVWSQWDAELRRIEG